MSALCELLEDPEQAAAWSREARARQASIGFVPTMGALHEGHLSLVRRASDENDVACVSVFINPLQFDEASDFVGYPRDLAADRELLSRAGCGMVFTGTLAGFFPEAPTPEAIALRDPGPEAEGLEGAFRKGHFAGVATICGRLFELVRPSRAYFGEKDFQQCLVVQRLARDLGYPTIVVGATSRDPDGLARSSRNRRLSAAEREEALALSAALFAARAAWSEGERDAVRLRRILLEHLSSPAISVEYAGIRDPKRWSADAPRGPLTEARALVAARVGPVRLIDNLNLASTAGGGA